MGQIKNNIDHKTAQVRK